MLFDYGCDINITDDCLETPLHMAARCGIEDNALTLLSKGADPNREGQNGVRPLHRAGNLGVVRVLLRHGADKSLPMTLTADDLGEDRPRRVTGWSIWSRTVF